MTNQPTRYELIATKDGIRYLAGYVRIPSKASAIKLLRSQKDAWLALWKDDDRITWKGKGRMGWSMTCGSWEIRFSGRTQLESLRSELPSFKSLLA